MKSQSWLVACMAAGSLAGGPVCGQPSAQPQAVMTAPGPAPSTVTLGAAPSTITLGAALDAAWPRSVAARESDGQRRRAVADRAATGHFWAAPPALALSHRDDRLQNNSGRRETEVGVAVPLWLPGQRAARAGTAEAAAAQAQAAEQVARLRLAGELREAAWQWAALQAEATQAEAQARALQQLADDVQRRVQAGDLARSDALAARAEQLAAAGAQADVQQRLQSAQARWALQTGLTAAPDVAAGTAATGETTSTASAASAADAAETTAAAAAATATATAAAAAVAVAAAATSIHPELQLASLSTALARQRLELLRHSRRDAPELTVGLRQDVAGRAAAAQGSWVVALRMPLGTSSRNRPLEAAALAELDLAQTHEERLRERLHSEAATARHTLRLAQAQLDAETARAGLLRERSNLIDKSFRAGETPLPEQLRALAASAQADSAVARQTAALGLARARLHHTLGLMP